MSKRLLAAGTVVILAMGLATAQEPKNENTMPDMDMSTHGKSAVTASDMHDMPAMGNDGSAHAMHSMEHRHMDMGPHMKMTTLRDLKPGDQGKADQVLEAARSSAEKYKDYRAALADGYKIFLPSAAEAVSLHELLVRIRGGDALQSGTSDLASLRKNWR